MRLLLPACFIILLFSITATAQTDSLTEQINEQVWKPFINTFNNMYTEGFMALHSKKLLRIPEDNNRIYNYDEYVQNIKTSNENGKKNKIRQSIELRFTNRFIQNEQAFETGYYKTTVVEPDGLKLAITVSFQSIRFNHRCFIIACFKCLFILYKPVCKP